MERKTPREQKFPGSGGERDGAVGSGQTEAQAYGTLKPQYI